jgi:ABC-2 type transport system permease protein
MRPILALIKANLKMTARNRAAFFWDLAFPAIFILIFGAVFSDQTVTFSVGIAGSESALRDGVTQAMEDLDSFDVHIGEANAELDALANGDRLIVVIFGQQSDGELPPVEVVYDEAAGPNGQLAQNAVLQVIQAVAGQGLGLDITQRGMSADHYSFIDFFVPGILAMSIMNSGVIGLSTAFVNYRERGILRRIRVTPFPLTQFILTRLASEVLIAIAQALILVALAWAVYDLNVVGNWALIFFVIVVGALAFLAIGFAISSVARNVMQAAVYANIITFPMLFLSGIFFSLDTAPEWLQPIARVLPLAYLVEALREPMTRGRGISEIWEELAALGLIFAVALFVAVRYFRWDAHDV